MVVAHSVGFRFGVGFGYGIHALLACIHKLEFIEGPTSFHTSIVPKSVTME